MSYTNIPTLVNRILPEKFQKSNFNILPFCEKPAQTAIQEDAKGQGNVTAADLFNLFTADIIRMDVLFIK